MIGFPDWQVAVETAQVVGGLVPYPPDNVFYIYHTRLWTVLHQLLALGLRAGVSEITLSLIVSGVQGMLTFQALAVVRLRAEPGRPSRGRRRSAHLSSRAPPNTAPSTPVPAGHAAHVRRGRACRRACSPCDCSAPAGIVPAHSCSGCRLASIRRSARGPALSSGLRCFRTCADLRASFGRPAMVSGGVQRHGRQPDDSVQSRTGDSCGMTRLSPEDLSTFVRLWDGHRAAVEILHDRSAC